MISEFYFGVFYFDPQIQIHHHLIKVAY